MARRPASDVEGPASPNNAVQQTGHVTNRLTQIAVQPQGELGGSDHADRGNTHKRMVTMSCARFRERLVDLLRRLPVR